MCFLKKNFFCQSLKLFRLHVLHEATKSIKVAAQLYGAFLLVIQFMFSSRFYMSYEVNLETSSLVSTKQNKNQLFFFLTEQYMFMEKSNKQTKNKNKWFRRGEMRSQISPPSSFLRAVILHQGQFCLPGDSCQWETLVVTARAEGRGSRIAVKHSAMHRTASVTKDFQPQ